jgi:hypothetical protein
METTATILHADLDAFYAFEQHRETAAITSTTEGSRSILDGKLRATPTVALIVVVGVEVKGTSRESACCRFFAKC